MQIIKMMIDYECIWAAALNTSEVTHILMDSLQI